MINLLVVLDFNIAINIYRILNCTEDQEVLASNI